MKSQILKNQLKKDELHHAYLIESTGEGVVKELNNFLENELSFPIKGNPDLWCGEFDTFGIDDGRAIKEMQSRRPLGGERKIFIIIANFFTTEAQNSLLKVFEEPTEGTHFFIITQNTDTLIPTLKSRMFELFTQRPGLCKESIHTKTVEMPVNVDEFLKSDKARRMTLLKDIIEDKNKNIALSFLNDLEIAIHNSERGISKLSKDAPTLKEIIKFKKYLNGRSSSIKMILENIALTVPRVG